MNDTCGYKTWRMHREKIIELAEKIAFHRAQAAALAAELDVVLMLPRGGDGAASVAPAEPASVGVPGPEKIDGPIAGRVLWFMQANSHLALSATEVARFLNLQSRVHIVRTTLARLAERGELRRTEPGVYQSAEPDCAAPTERAKPVGDLIPLGRWPSDTAMVRSLTPREREVAHLTLEGYGARQIGARLGISAITVGVHLTKLYAKLGVTGRDELVALLLSPPNSAPTDVPPTSGGESRSPQGRREGGRDRAD